MDKEIQADVVDKKRPHRERKSGRKAEKKKAKKQHVQELTDRQKNPKAFSLKSVVQAERRFRRKQDLETKKQHIPVVDRNPVEPPPIVVVVVGPPKVGKTTLIHNLIKHFTKQPLASVKGPVTIVTGKRQRITLVECNNDITCMIDLAKVADLVLLLLDASFGFEMEIFEFLNICQVHGMPRILGVLTHLDLLKNNKQLKKTKKTLKHRFWTEVYPGAKLFYLSGIIHGEYLKNDIRNLGRFISVIKFRPLMWRSTHPYILVDRLEDITDPENIRQNFKCDRNICLYGFVRGVALNKENSIHIPGCGDTKITNVSFLPDPCPLPEKKKRSLIEREKKIYAPFSGVGGIVYDKDAVYVELAGNNNYKETESEGTELVNSILTTQDGIDIKRDKSELRVFSHSKPIVSNEFKDKGNFTSRDLHNEEKIAEITDSTDESSNESDEEQVENNNKKNYLEEQIEQDGRIRRKVLFKNDIEISSEKGEKDTLNDELHNFKIEGSKSDSESMRSHEEDNKDDEDKNVEEEEDENVEEEEDENVEDEEDENVEVEEDENVEDEEDENVEDEEDEASDEDEKDEEALHGKEEIEKSDNYCEVNILSENRKRKLDLGEYKATKKSKMKEVFDFESSAIKWKENLTQRASEAFLERQNNTQNLYKLVYGNTKRLLDAGQENNSGQEDSTREIGGIFHTVSEKQRQKISEKDLLDEFDNSIFVFPLIRDWTSSEMKTLIRDCFVTGKWKKSEDAKELLKLDTSDNEFGDFEDLETGEKHENTESETKEQLIEKKKKLKEKFDAEYDEKEEYSYYSDLKAQVNQQAQLNKSEFEGLSDNIRVELEGYRPGMYIRVELSNMPFELVEYFDPTYPLIIGGLLPVEENIGFIQVRMKKHRWYSKILKTKDPLIVSLGWRRFQTLPVFSKLEDNLRQRMLKYSPEHVSCMAHFYGPITPQGTGFLGVQDVATRTPGFRIACTGSVVEVDKSTKITKKLKLVGTPLKIYKKTVFIQGMFNSALEVGKFEGAKIRTVSGIRGQIKKAISKPEGAFRATFEDKIKLSDIVFCRTWYAVEVSKFYNPVTTLLLSPERKAMWEGMKTLGQLKRERNLKNEAQPDSLYTPIKRNPKIFKPLKIPKALQKALPYKDKPKNPPKNANDADSKRVAVIKEPHEEKVASLMRMIRTNFEQKKYLDKKAMIERVKKHKQMKRAEEMKKLKRQKELKKKIFRTLNKMEKNKNNNNNK